MQSLAFDLADVDVAGPVDGKAVRQLELVWFPACAAPFGERFAGRRGVRAFIRPELTKYSEPIIDDYAEKTKQTVIAWRGMNGLRGDDPAKLAKVLIQLASKAEPPLRWAAGADAIGIFDKKSKNLLAQANAFRELSSSLAHDATNT